jgi:thiol-disulfide isomerase/thioredoxin
MCNRSRAVCVLLAPLVIVPWLCAQEERKPQTPKQQYQALLEEYERASVAWKQSGKRLQMADAAWREHYAASPKWSFGPRFLQFAEANPTEPEAVDALLQIVGFQESVDSYDRSIYSVITRTLSLLTAHHLQDERVAQECMRSSRVLLPNMVPYFQALTDKSEDREVRAYACWKLIGYNLGKLSYFDRRAAAPPSDRPEDRETRQFIMARQDPEFVRQVEATIKKADKAVISRETEALLERLISEYGDVPFPPSWVKARRVETQRKASRAPAPSIKADETLGDQARLRLDALRSLAVGQVPPDIQGDDTYGKPMKLTEYRGKVVVLVFWGTWCGPCMGLVPHEKALVERFKGRPFALLGINSDSDRAKLRATMEKEGIDWRSWWDGGKIGGPIAARWDVKVWPTIVVLDEKGVIRYKHVRHTAHEELADAVDSLLNAMTHEEDRGTAGR